MREAATQLAGQAAVIQINTQENPRLAERFQVRGIPMLAIIRRGQLLDSLTGARPVPEIVSWFRRVMARQVDK